MKVETIFESDEEVTLWDLCNAAHNNGDKVVVVTSKLLSQTKLNLSDLPYYTTHFSYKKGDTQYTALCLR